MAIDTTVRRALPPRRPLPAHATGARPATPIDDNAGPPKGLFRRIQGDRRTHLFIATGTGLAPFVAMLETYLLEPDPPRAVVVHGVARVAELAYRERFERWEAGELVSYVPSVSRPGDPSNLLRRGLADDAIRSEHYWPA